MAKLTGAQVLALPMDENDAGAKTIKEYLLALLEQLWAEGEGFSSKRPFGNSGWEYELRGPIAAATQGELDDDAVDAMIFEAIQALA